MKIVRSMEAFGGTGRPVVLAAGCFDGLHIGHAAVIRAAIDRARAIGGEAWVFGFDPHPAKVLDPAHAPPLICTAAQQAMQLQDLGVDGCILQPFTADFIRLEPTAFFDSLVRNVPGLEGLSVGEDWSFGRNRAGDAELLARLCGERHLFFFAQPAVCWKGERVSSTRIREAIRLGQLAEAAGMLGRPVATIGTVVHGEKIGRRLGYPTANIAPDNELLPPRGIYAARLRTGSREHAAAAYIGHRGTLRENHPQVLEAHLLDGRGIDLYGRQVEVRYLEYLRGDRVFADAEALKHQIEADLAAIRALLQ